MVTRNLKRIYLYCPEYKTNATINIVEDHPSGTPHLVVDYEKGGSQGTTRWPPQFRMIGPTGI